MTSTYLPIYVTFLKDHKDFNSSTSLKYLLLPTGACVCLQVHAHTHTRTHVYVFICTCAHLPSFHLYHHEALIFPNLREGIIFKAENRWYLRESLQTVSPFHFQSSSALFYLKKERRAKEFHSHRTMLSTLNYFSQIGRFPFHLILLLY